MLQSNLTPLIRHGSGTPSHSLSASNLDMGAAATCASTAKLKMVPRMATAREADLVERERERDMVTVKKRESRRLPESLMKRIGLT